MSKKLLAPAKEGQTRKGAQKRVSHLTSYATCNARQVTWQEIKAEQCVSGGARDEALPTEKTLS